MTRASGDCAAAVCECALPAKFRVERGRRVVQIAAAGTRVQLRPVALRGKRCRQRRESSERREGAERAGRAKAGMFGANGANGKVV